MVNEFIIGIVSSILGSLILLVVLPIFSRKFKNIVISTIGKLIGFDIQLVFQNRKELEIDLKSELKKSSSIKIFTTRGNELKSKTFTKSIQSKSSDNVKILLPKTDGRNNHFLKMREQELIRTSKNDRENTTIFYRNSLIEDVKNNASFFEGLAKNNDLELGSFVAPLIGRIVILEHTAYFTIYRNDKEGSNCKTVKCPRGGDFYHFLDRFFDQLWSHNKKDSYYSY